MSVQLRHSVRVFTPYVMLSTFAVYDW